MTGHVDALVSVRPMKWAKRPRTKIWLCYTPVGTYKVLVAGVRVEWEFAGFTEVRTGRSETVAEAMAAAQADLSSRIMPMLEAKP